MIAFAITSLLVGLIYIVVSYFIFIGHNVVMAYHTSNIPYEKKQKFKNIMGFLFLIPGLIFITVGILEFVIENSTMSLITMLTLFGGIIIQTIVVVIVIKVFNKKFIGLG